MHYLKLHFNCPVKKIIGSQLYIVLKIKYWQRYCMVAALYNQIQRCSNANADNKVGVALPQSWIVISTYNILQMLYCQRCCSVRIMALNLHLHNADTTTSNLKRCVNFASTLGSTFTSQYIMDNAMTPSIECGNRDIKFTTSSRRRYYDVALALLWLWKEGQMWIIYGYKYLFP